MGAIDIDNTGCALRLITVDVSAVLPEVVSVVTNVNFKSDGETEPAGMLTVLLLPRSMRAPAVVRQLAPLVASAQLQEYVRASGAEALAAGSFDLDPSMKRGFDVVLVVDCPPLMDATNGGKSTVTVTSAKPVLLGSVVGYPLS